MALRRLVLLCLGLALVLSGCFSSRTKAPPVEDGGLLIVPLSESAPPPPSPYNPPILAAIVNPAPLVDGFEECQRRLNDPEDFLERICAADWSRTIITPGEQERISVVLMTGPEVTRFRIIFAGHRPGQVAEGVALSREYVAPPYWSGEMIFDVPLYPPFTRVFFLQIEWRSDESWSPASQDIIFAPCPDDLPWPDEDSKLWCEAHAR